jgi:hypothetical protein
LQLPEKRRITVTQHLTNKESIVADKLTRVDYYTTTISNTSGQGVKILAGLADAGVNLAAFSGFPAGRRAQLDFVPDKPDKFLRAAKSLKLKLSAKKTCFVFHGNDRVGALTKIFSKLAQARINVTAAQAVGAGKGRCGAIFWVKPGNAAKAAKLLGAK